MAKINSNDLPTTSFTDNTAQDNNQALNILYDASGTFARNMNTATSSKAVGQAVVGNTNEDGEAAINNDLYRIALHGSNIFMKDEIDLYNNIYRFGLFNPYGAVSSAREYLFFTKPDLNIIRREDKTGAFVFFDKKLNRSFNYDLNEELEKLPFWQELYDERRDTVRMLQNSYSPGWNMLLQNSVVSNLEIPGIEGTVIDSPVNDYGVGFQYRGTSEASDDSLEFSLEFKDTKWLDVYNFFKAYEEYQIMKHHGTVSPWKQYIANRILHDQFAIYKFIVGEDMETLIYWGKLYGVMPMNLPREVFSQAEFSNGLSYTISFKAAFFEDMRKEILIDFNNLGKEFNGSGNGGVYQYETYNSQTGMGDYRPAKSAYIARYQRPDSPSGWCYKLKWRGDKNY